MNLLKIKLLEDHDIPFMKAWLRKKYIMDWYEHPDDWLTEIYGRFEEFSFVKHFIATYDGFPIGFCQYYKCLDGNEDWYGTVPLKGSYSIDYLIGEEDYLGKGFGKAIIALLMEEVFSLEEAQRIIVAPEKENKASCHALLSSGFVFDEENKLYCFIKS